jgi:hypothetical protein
VNGSATVLSTTELSYNKTGGPVRPVAGDRWTGGPVAHCHRRIPNLDQHDTERDLYAILHINKDVCYLNQYLIIEYHIF